MNTVSREQARQWALAAQGFAAPRPTGRVDTRHFRKVLKRMVVLQIDSVNVLCRSHFLPVFARLGAYDRDKLDDWLWRSGENLEHVSHEASITSMELYPLIRHRMTLDRWKSGARFKQAQAAYLDALRKEITERGPLSIKDLSDAGKKSETMWGWSKGKLALSVMYRSGELAIANRDKNLVTHYDLPERVIPGHLLNAYGHNGKEATRKLLLLAAQAHGIATDKDLADYFRHRVTVCRPILHELVEEGLLEAVRVQGWKDTAYIVASAKRPTKVDARALLSPFDPVVWFRPRAERLFNFHYRIEIYVPEEKRVHGYYVLPFLLGDQLVARVDLKADRKSRTLQVKGAYLEAKQSADRVAPELAKTLGEMAEWLSLSEVSVGRQGNLASALSRSLASIRG